MIQRESGAFSIKSAARAALSPALWTLLRRWRLRWSVATYPRRIVEHHYAGIPLKLLISDDMSRAWYDQDWLEPPVIELLRGHRLREGAVVFNLGAHQAVIALILANVVGRSGRVVALEAMPFNASVARRNRDMNDAPQVTIVNAAVGEERGILRFIPSLNGSVEVGGSAWGKFQVEAVSIDDLSRRYGRPDVVFMDIEGFECRALRGAATTLARRPDCVVEVHAGGLLESFGGSLEGLLAFFPPTAFELYMGPEWRRSETDPGWRPFDPDDDLVKEPFYLIALGKTGDGGSR